MSILCRDLCDIILFIPENGAVRGESFLSVSRVKTLRFTEVTYRLQVISWQSSDLKLPFFLTLAYTKLLTLQSAVETSSHSISTQEACTKKQRSV